MRGREPILGGIRTVVLLTVVVVVAAGAVGWAVGRHGTPEGPRPLTSTSFALVRDGMSRTKVLEALGTPLRATESLAEGLTWPEPADSCWYYGSPDGRREYQICFVAGVVETHGSYPVVPQGGP